MKKIRDNNEDDPLPSIQFIVSYDMKCHAGFNQGGCVMGTSIRIRWVINMPRTSS